MTQLHNLTKVPTGPRRLSLSERTESSHSSTEEKEERPLLFPNKSPSYKQHFGQHIQNKPLSLSLNKEELTALNLESEQQTLIKVTKQEKGTLINDKLKKNRDLDAAYASKIEDISAQITKKEDEIASKVALKNIFLILGAPVLLCVELFMAPLAASIAFLIVGTAPFWLGMSLPLLIIVVPLVILGGLYILTLTGFFTSALISCLRLNSSKNSIDELQKEQLRLAFERFRLTGADRDIKEFWALLEEKFLRKLTLAIVDNINKTLHEDVMMRLKTDPDFFENVRDSFYNLDSKKILENYFWKQRMELLVKEFKIFVDEVFCFILKKNRNSEAENCLARLLKRISIPGKPLSIEGKSIKLELNKEIFFPELYLPRGLGKLGLKTAWIGIVTFLIHSGQTALAKRFLEELEPEERMAIFCNPKNKKNCFLDQERIEFISDKLELGEEFKFTHFTYTTDEHSKAKKRVALALPKDIGMLIEKFAYDPSTNGPSTNSVAPDDSVAPDEKKADFLPSLNVKRERRPSSELQKNSSDLKSKIDERFFSYLGVS